MKYSVLLISLFITGCGSLNLDNHSPLVSIQIQDRNGLTETISSPDKLEVFNEMDFLASQPYKKVLRVYKHSGRNSAKITTYHSNGVPWQYLEAEDSRAHGQYKEWYPSGQVRIEATVIGGTADITPGAQQDWLFDKTALVYGEQGNLVAEILYEKGSMEGTSTYYHPDGSIQKKLPYRNNEIDGEALEFFPDGKVYSRTNYASGVKEGESKGYWTEEQVMWKEKYQKGLLQEGLYCDSAGNETSKVVFSQGFQSVFESDHLSHLIEIRKGKPEGLVKLFSSGGELQQAYYTKQGKKHGEETHFYPAAEIEGDQTSQTKLTVSWIDDAVSGMVKTWYPNGKLESQREFSRNKKNGSSLSWYADGGLMLIEEYEEDRLINGNYYKKNGKDPVSTISNGNGIATLYDNQGIFLRRVQYLKGKPVDQEG